MRRSRGVVAAYVVLCLMATAPDCVGAPASPAPATVPPAEAPQKTPPAPGAPPKAAAPQAPVSIPVPEIVAKAQEVTKLLRKLDALAAPVPEIVAIQTRLPDISTKLGPELKSTVEILEQGPPIGIQERLTQSWQASSSELAGWLDIITKRATQLERELDRLASLRATWAQTRIDAQASRAPTPVVQNVETVLADIEAARVRLQAQRAVTLVLQDQVAEQAKRCQHALAEITRLRQGSLALTLTRSSPPIWSHELRRADFERMPARLGEELGASVTLLLLGILRPLIARAMAPVLYAFAVLILVDRVRAQLVVTPLGDQVVLLMGAPGVDGSLRPVARDQERPERCRLRPT